MIASSSFHVCTYTTNTMKTNLRVWEKRDYGNGLGKKKSSLSGESWDRSKWAGERILEKWKCYAGGHPEANLTWVINDLFQLWTRALWPSGPDVLPWSLCCIAHKIKKGLEFNSRPFIVLSSIFNGAILWKYRVLVTEALVSLPYPVISP